MAGIVVHSGGGSSGSSSKISISGWFWLASLVGQKKKKMSVAHSVAHSLLLTLPSTRLHTKIYPNQMENTEA